MKQKVEVSPSKIRRTVQYEHSYVAAEASQAGKITALSKKTKVLQQKICRKNKKVKHMKDLLETLEAQQSIAQNQAMLLEYNFSGVAKGIFAIQMKNPQMYSRHGCRYSSEINKAVCHDFALIFT